MSTLVGLDSMDQKTPRKELQTGWGGGVKGVSMVPQKLASWGSALKKKANGLP